MQRTILKHRQIWPCRWHLLILAFGAALSISSHAMAAPPTDEQRLERLAERLESARIEQHVPGMAVAVVKDDEVIFARAFGLANIAEEILVTPETIFAIGSTTKAFTATTIGMLVDEGRMTWEDPVSKWLPYFKPSVDSADDAQVLISDMLSHRTGFTRMTLLWVNGKVPRETILRTANNAKPWSGYREKFLYNNVMFMAAGMCAGAAADSTWEALIEERIFEPLGMNDSNLTYEAAQADPRLALGYTWKSEEEDWVHAPMRNIDQIGPAGSINSNVLDMARWVRFQLGRGEFESHRLLSEEAHAETWKSHMKIRGPVDYGFGWMLREWKGRRVVEHGGGIDGFAAQVALLPEENLGFVLLMNLSASPLREASLSMVFDALLDEWPDESTVAEAQEIDFEDYVGIYIANFATFRDEEFEILINDDRLALDVPSQRTFDLNQPDEEGKWSFALTDQVAISFKRNDQGAVVGLTMHQAGFDFEVPRKGVEIQPDVPVEELEKYVGTFVRAEGGKQVKIFIERGRLAMEDRGKHLAFNTPDAEGHASLRARADYGATFKTDAEGNVESFVFHSNAGDKLFTRLADSPDPELPTLDEVFALARLDERQAALVSAAPLRLRGEARFVQSGIAGTYQMILDAGERYRADIDLGIFGSIHNAVNRDAGWADLSFKEFQELTGRWLEAARLDHPASYLGDWRSFFDDIRVTDWDEVDGRKVIVLELRAGDLPARTTSIDAQTGDILKINTSVETPELPGVKIPAVTYLRDWREAGGVRLPHTIVVETEQNGRFITTVTEVETGVTLDDAYFILSREEK